MHPALPQYPRVSSARLFDWLSPVKYHVFFDIVKCMAIVSVNVALYYQTNYINKSLNLCKVCVTSGSFVVIRMRQP